MRCFQVNVRKGPTDIKQYLEAHENRQIRSGKSGARVWEIEDRYVLKYVQREKLPEPGVFALYQNEAYFYQYFEQDRHGEALSCLPEVLDVQVSDREILILMKKYQQISRTEAGEGLLQKIMGTLAMIHTREVPVFLRQEQKPPGYLEKEQIESCLDGWRSVLEEHPGVFDERILTEAAAKINETIGWHHEEKKVLCHGDFHWDNLLRRENGDIVVCDWQGVGTGGASGDISFFLSRLGADGTDIEPGKVTELYCHERFLRTGEAISPKELLRHMMAANLIISFQCWHQYLHGSSRERVRGIYEKMVMEL